MTVDLAGRWEAHLDRSGTGADSANIPLEFEEEVSLPGALSSQGFGDEPGVDTEWTGDIFDPSWYTEADYAPYRKEGAIKIPFWLQPDRRFVGPAWYRKVVDLPEAMVGRRLVLFLERPHWETRLWLDGRYIGSNDSLSVPHEYDLGIVRRAGARAIVLRVDNRMIVKVGPNSHSMADHTQGNWNGIAGGLRLVAGSPVWIDRVEVFPSIRRRSALVRARIGNALDGPASGLFRLYPEGGTGEAAYESAALSLAPGVSVEHFEYRLPEGSMPWDEFSPRLQRLVAELSADAGAEGSVRDSMPFSFGLREVSALGTQLAVNGRPVFLRGTLECCVFPLTGYPPTDLASWRRLLGRVKEHGLNHVRFHSWCPPDPAFSVADELGLYLQVECGSWANQGASVGQDRRFDEWLFREGERIVARHGNHPSFVMMAYGNEPDGRTEDFLGLWVSYWKGRDDRRVYTGAAGWPAIEENDYHDIPEPRVQAWGEGLGSRINALPPETRTDYREIVGSHAKPIVSHEIGQWCAFPNFDEIGKYSGPLKARNFEIFRDFLAARGMGDQARDFLLASGMLQVACYKEEIESALRTPGFGGFQLLGLSDFPGQGTALVGVLDAFWDPKGYVSPEEFRAFCSRVVPLARMGKRYWLASESFVAEVEVANYGGEPLEGVSWELLGPDGEAAASGRLEGAAIPEGRLSAVGRIEMPLANLVPSARYELAVSVGSRDAGPAGRNSWDIWLFPDELEAAHSSDIHITSALDEGAVSILAAGGKVLLLLPAGRVKTDVALGFSSVFWNTSWTKGQAPHSLGILCDPGHPAFSLFPTRSYSDWLWWELVHGAAAMVLDDLPSALRPIVQPIDTWFRSHKLGLLFEALIGTGKLLVSSMDLSADLDRRPVARQLRHSLLAYMESGAFRPEQSLRIEDLAGLTS
jgi:hypothetical protein